MKKAVVACILVLASAAASVYAQSVVELARQEKARREALKNRPARVVTNADLASVTKAPAIVVAPAAPGGTASSYQPVPPPPDASTVGRMVPVVSKEGPRLFGGSEDAASAPSSSENVEARLKAVQERIDLLTTKMNALWQEFYAANTMTPQGVIQQRIDETYQKLVKAQEEEAKLQAQLPSGKSGLPDKR